VHQTPWFSDYAAEIALLQYSAIKSITTTLLLPLLLMDIKSEIMSSIQIMLNNVENSPSNTVTFYFLLVLF